MINKTIEKTVYFYKTYAEPSIFVKKEQDAEMLYGLFKEDFSHGCEIYSYSEDGNTHRFDIKSFEREYIFGTYCKEEIKPNPFMQFRDLDTNSTSDIISSDEKNKVLEYYTFFYVDFNKGMAAVIYNRQAGALDKVLRSYFYANNLSLNMYAYCINDLKEGIKRFKHVNRMEYVYNEKSASKAFKTLKHSQDALDLEVDSLKINIGISSCGPKFREDIEKNYSPEEFASVKVYGDSDDNINQSFDLIKKSFMRSAKININDNPRESFEQIMDVLSVEILKIKND